MLQPLFASQVRSFVFSLWSCWIWWLWAIVIIVLELFLEMYLLHMRLFYCTLCYGRLLEWIRHQFFQDLTLKKGLHIHVYSRGFRTLAPRIPKDLECNLSALTQLYLIPLYTHIYIYIYIYIVYNIDDTLYISRESIFGKHAKRKYCIMIGWLCLQYNSLSPWHLHQKLHFGHGSPFIKLLFASGAIATYIT